MSDGHTHCQELSESIRENLGVIGNFYPDTPYYFLSNFFPCPVKYDGHIYPSSENAYQAAKVLPENRDKDWFIHTTCTAAESKKLGRKLKLRDDWEDIKYRIMADILEAKFRQNDDIARSLINTFPYTLIEGNWWGDRVWGVCAGSGKNMLGKLLMLLRDKLRMEMLFN